jgi:class 3 adenylate cyclase
MAQLELRRQLKEREVQLNEIRSATAVDAEQMARADYLIRQVLPERVADELSAKGHVEPRYHESTTILFSKLSSPNRASEAHEPARLVAHLSQFFTRFDEIADANRLETLKTIGETYISAGGLHNASRTHALEACVAALQMQLFVRNANRQREKLRLPPWVLRVGINTGSLVAGVVGTHRLTYDIWGNAVNVAQRIQEACDPGRVNVSASTLHQLGSLFESEARGAVQVKHLGPMDMYFLGRIRPQFSADADGVVPNDEFWRWSGGRPSLASGPGLRTAGS